MKEFVGSGWKKNLELNELESFDSIWELDAAWFEEPNKRRGGWSGVSRISLKTEEGGSVGIFLKRQENHNTKTLAKPVNGEPTFYREFKNILRFISHGIPTVEPVYFFYRYKNGKSQAILMTKELEGFESLDSPIYARSGELMSNKDQRESLMKAVAKEMRKMHDHHFRHNCLYSKHIFVRAIGNQWDVKFIDLEKLSRSFFKKRALLRDLYTLPRRISGWRQSDKLKFFKMYRQEEKLSPQSKLIWCEIHNRMLSKNKL
jgi:tRNA A-37 threonylcarbamoyl transferase component Bud32